LPIMGGVVRVETRYGIMGVSSAVALSALLGIMRQLERDNTALHQLERRTGWSRIEDRGQQGEVRYFARESRRVEGRRLGASEGCMQLTCRCNDVVLRAAFDGKCRGCQWQPGTCVVHPRFACALCLTDSLRRNPHPQLFSTSLGPLIRTRSGARQQK
jgi:hypothetical protein